MLRYFKPYFYVIYLHKAIPGHKGYVSFLSRSKDLIEWELSPFNPILEASPGEGINNSDVDLFEYEGNTYIYYATGTQTAPPKGWGTVKIAMYNGPLKEFYEKHFPKNTSTIKLSTRIK